ncbi:MAG: hypothetical protein ACYC25_06395, partial [Paludibacter sp.]
CSINADLYEKGDSSYYLIETIDQNIPIEGGITTGKRVLQTGDSIISTLISSNLLKRGNHEVGLSYRDVVSSDSIAKRKIKIYNTTQFTNGVYYNYNSFKNQTPDILANISVKRNKIRSVSSIDSIGNVKKIYPKEVYALVVDGRPFISTGFGFYPLAFENDEFIFTGKMGVSFTSGQVALLGLAASIALSSAETTSEFEAMINYKNGELIRLRELNTFADEDNR